MVLQRDMLPHPHPKKPWLPPPPPLDQEQSNQIICVSAARHSESVGVVHDSQMLEDLEMAGFEKKMVKV